MGQILVKVRDKSVDDDGDPTLNTGVETVITYNAFKHTEYKYELICQVRPALDTKGNPKLDEKGEAIYEEVPGNPNLGALHQQVAERKGAAHAANAGPSQREIELMQEIERLKNTPVNTPTTAAPVEVTSQPSAPVQKKRGPKPKLQEQAA